MSNGVANGLVAVGVEPGDRVTLYGPNCWEWVVAYYAIAKTGAVVNPISSMFTAEEVRYVVADSGARVVVAAIDKGLPILDLVGTAACRLSCCGARTYRPVPRRSRSGSTTGDAAFARVPREPARPGGDLLHVGDHRPPEGCDAEPPCGHRRRGRTVLMGAHGPDDRVLNALPLAHVYGICVFNAAMMAGSTLIMMPRFNEETVMAAIASTGRP